MQVLLAVLAVNALFLVLMGIAARAAGVPVTRFSYGIGPKIVKTRVAGVELEVGPIPSSAYVKLDGFEEDDEPPRGFRLLSPAIRAAVVLFPWAALLGVAALLMGPGEVFTVIGRATGLAFCDIDTARSTWLRILALPPAVAWGSVFAVVSAWNLLPLPALAGGAALQTLLEGRAGRFPRFRKAYRTLVVITLLFWVVIARWLWALSLALFH